MAESPKRAELAPFNIDKNNIRPVLTNLNGDSSWLLSLPRPTSERSTTGRCFYHVVVDPWLADTPGVFVHPWIGQFRRKSPSAVPDGPAVDAVVRSVEEAAGSSAHADASVDAIFVCFFAADHLHYDTLTTFDPSIPVFASPGAKRTLSRWGHFKTIVAIGLFDATSSSWQTTHPGAALAPYVNVLRINNFTVPFGVAFTWSHGEGESSKHETFLYYPHGCDVDNDHALAQFVESSPRPDIVALMHPTKDVFRYGWAMTTSASNGAKSLKKVRPKQWIIANDGALEYSGAFFVGFGEAWPTRDEVMEMLGEDESDKALHARRSGPIEVGSGRHLLL